MKVSREPDKLNISSGQRKIQDFLTKAGLLVESEKTIGSFRVDIFLPELNTIVEFDGPWMHHSVRHETLRDVTLKLLGVKEVLHVSGTSKAELKELARKLGYEGN